LYGAAAFGDFVVNRNYSPTPSGWAIILLSAAVLALGGCGRKGGLDLPPTASSAQPMGTAPGDSEAEQASKPSVFNPYYGTDAPPAAPKGSKKAFILDPLLND
jgi:predicted small lipoprotein YifL